MLKDRPRLRAGALPKKAALTYRLKSSQREYA